ncbi:hypothetical protein ACGLQ7_004111 [Escherichia albertii]|uniref:Uncharacterized protein n=2 Tax=Escherichia albertii TaxID=208962 RepID=A0A7Z7YK29_ESCAL|nr:hypothetical protein [Escherichia albertii]MCQ8936088.1 hypothetical protein [Escherichia albertii]TBR49611.1 hypothetical protein EYS06_18585 [Escherichia albertii]UUL06304.1 hypothetical protein NIZ17_03925 [Escherichia albertii]WDB46813.1 hypothetical protein PS038_16880 [Escherichia albertii]HEB1565716.1 hypothetical protein [Escherichia albertii]
MDFGERITFSFKRESRSLYNYIERHLKKMKYQTINLKKICFVCQKEPLFESYINSCNILCVSVFMNEDDYISRAKDNLNSYFIYLLTIGIEKCNTTHFLPKDEMIYTIDNFKNSRYINDMDIQEKRAHKYRIDCIVKCQLSIDEFTLDIEFKQQLKTIYRENVITDIPNEYVFNYHLKDLLLIDDDDCNH